MLAARKAGVQFQLGLRATARDVLALEPDAVIVATGSTMSWPKTLPTEWGEAGIVTDLRQCMTDLMSLTRRQGGTAVIHDLDATEGTYASAERLRQLFDRVVIVTPRDRIAEDVPLVTRLGLLRRFAHQRIETFTLAEPDAESRWEEGVLVCRNIYSGELREIPEVALFTYSSPRVAQVELVAEIEGRGIQVHVIGDAYAPRGTLAATSQGHSVGNLIT
jgi:hypothetical protein